jgi:hypothetical protein
MAMDSKRRNRQRSTELARSSEELPPPPADAPAEPKKRPASIRETQGWKTSQQGIKRFWNNYKEILITAFNRMSRAEQEGLVTRMCVIVTIGVTGLGLLLFYNFIPRMVRVVAVPSALFAAWWAGNRIVAPVVLGRLENFLNKE